ncbi:MAG: response regulator [Treponema sp.]|jgi:signal transduction histidine kinase/DNA-binding response OmpR family regulator|nr:response regulator [Treponema sp.]
MKKKSEAFISKYFFSEKLPLEGRVFNLVLIFGIFACMAAMIARIIEGVSLTAIIAVAGIIVVIVIAFFICNTYRIYHLGIWAALIVVCDILFPLVFFTNAGADSGMAGYFVLTIVLIFLLLRGWECAVMLFSHILFVISCYLIQKYHPALVVPFTSDFQKYVDHLQTILVSGLFIGVVIKYQNRIYEEEKNKAEAATRAKADFLANVSHEIRTPLNAIIGLGELELGKDLEKETYNNLEKIHNSGKVLLSIINDLLDISKIESGRFDLIPVDYETASLINDTVNLNIVRIGSKPVTFHLQIDENLPSALHGDEIRIRQIFNNLLSNAFKYTKEGNVTLHIRAEKPEDEEPEKNIWFICEVKDTGIGIRQEDVGKLFSVYNQVDTRSNRHIEGTGLGLSICKNLVEMMGGSITVESEYGKGSVFTIRIKQGISNETPIGKKTRENLESFSFSMKKRERRKHTRIHMPYARVLVVDDVDTNLDVAKGMMLPYGLTIDCVSSGKEAIRLIREKQITYNAVFMDHMMPEMDGIEAVRIIRHEIDSEYARTVPIIALTANAIIGNDTMFLEKGFQDFLSKPIDMAKLDFCLNRWVRDREQEAALNITAITEEQIPEAEKNETPVIEGLNFAEGVKRMGDRESSYLRVLGSYAANMPAMLDKIRGFSADSIKDYTITIHGIKGSSYGICANETGRQAEALEMAAKQGDIKTILADNGRFIAETEKLAERISGFLAAK